MIHTQHNHPTSYFHPINWDRVNMPELHEEVLSLDLPYGKVEFKQWSFDGIVVQHTKNQYNSNQLLLNRNLINAVGLEFNIRGSFDIFHAGNTYQVNGNQHNIIYTPQVDNTFINKESSSESFKIYFQPETFLKIVEKSNDQLKRFAEGVVAGKPTVMSTISPVISPKLKQIIAEILNNRYTGSIKRVFLYSKCLEILVLQAESFNTSQKDIDPEKKKVEDARNYLLENFNDPPTLKALCRMVGLNEYRLKRDFKATYNTTVFGYLSDFRLEKARQSLISTHQTIGEIAYEMGYSSPQHFSSAFKKRFGVSPTDLRK